MKSNLNSAGRHWWDDRDASERDTALISFREERRRKHTTGWRRNIMLGMVVVAVPVLVRLATTM